MLPKALASRSILLSRLHCAEKSLLLVKLAPLGISIRAPTRSVLDGYPGSNPDCNMGIGTDKLAPSRGVFTDEAALRQMSFRVDDEVPEAIR
jgi:hypothetical protein